MKPYCLVSIAMQNKNLERDFLHKRPAPTQVEGGTVEIFFESKYRETFFEELSGRTC